MTRPPVNSEVGIQKLSWFLSRNNDGNGIIICLDVSTEIQQFLIPPSQRCSPALTEPDPKEVMIQDWKALVLHDCWRLLRPPPPLSGVLCPPGRSLPVGYPLFFLPPLASSPPTHPPYESP